MPAAAAAAAAAAVGLELLEGCTLLEADELAAPGMLLLFAWHTACTTTMGDVNDVGLSWTWGDVHLDSVILGFTAPCGAQRHRACYPPCACAPASSLDSAARSARARWGAVLTGRPE